MSPLLLVLSFLFATAFGAAPIELQVSHQAPAQNGVAVDLFVNNHQAFTDITYSEFSDWVDVSQYASETDPSVFNLTLRTSDTHASLATGLYDLSGSGFWSYFILTNDTSVTTLVEADTFSQPEQFHGLWRSANFAPVEQAFDLFVNGQKQSSFNPEELSAYASNPNGIYTFEVKNSTGTSFAAINATLGSGNVVSVIFNGDSTRGSTAFGLQVHLDQDYSAAYNSCSVRVVNAVADSRYNSLQPIFVPGLSNPFGKVVYSEVTEYASLDAQDYRVYFSQSEDSYEDSLYIKFTCEVGQQYTLTYQGNPNTTGPLAVSASVNTDNGLSPYYQEAKLRVHFLSTSYAQDVTVFLNGENVGTVSYLDPNSDDLSVTSNTAVLRFFQDQEELFNDTITVSLGASFSYFVLGLDNSTDYPLDGALATDSTIDTPTTTTTTTGTSTGTSTGATTGTTGHDDDDDDDDDDELSGGEIAGIVIGVIVGVALLGGLIFWLVRRQRRSQFSTIG